MRLAVRDGYKRLLGTSMETEARLESKRRADAAAIDVFAQNLRQLLLAPPLGQKRVLAIDPGFRTGCKVVVLDAQGRLLHNDVVYPDQGQQKTREAEETIRMGRGELVMIRRVASMPSSSGICTSIVMRSGVSRSAISKCDISGALMNAAVFFTSTSIVRRGSVQSPAVNAAPTV